MEIEQSSAKAVPGSRPGQDKASRDALQKIGNEIVEGTFDW